MRIADICPTCATYINASCIIYNGEVLSNINVTPLTSLDEILSNINDAFEAKTGAGVPGPIPDFVGQLYIDTLNDGLWIGLDDNVPNWGFIGTFSTSTTTTTTTTTSA